MGKALGMDKRPAYTELGQHIYEPYRNHLFTGEKADAELIQAEQLGYFLRTPIEGGYAWQVTRKGIRHLERILNVRIDLPYYLPQYAFPTEDAYREG